LNATSAQDGEPRVPACVGGTVASTAPACHPPGSARTQDRRTCGHSGHLMAHGQGSICLAMKPVFDMDDRARLPWRFFGAQSSVRARR
jgi:hypothetical protein